MADSEDYFAETSRLAQVLAGLALGILSLPFLAMGVVVLVMILTGEPEQTGTVVVALLFTLAGFGCAVLAWRLVSGRKRARDGGLMSPTALRVSAAVWVAGAGLVLVQHPVAILELGVLIFVPFALVALATRRERQLGI